MYQARLLRRHRQPPSAHHQGPHLPEGCGLCLYGVHLRRPLPRPHARLCGRAGENFAAHLRPDMDIGLSMSTEFNQDMGTETTLTGNLYYYLVLLLLITSDFYTYLVRAVTDSFSVIPIAHQKFAWDHLLSAITRYMGDSFIIGFRIFLPFFACIMVLNCVLGIMARVAPQMNMFSIGMQLKILVGFVVLYLIVFLLPNVANYIFDEIKTMVKLVAEGLY